MLQKAAEAAESFSKYSYSQEKFVTSSCDITCHIPYLKLHSHFLNQIQGLLINVLIRAWHVRDMIERFHQTFKCFICLD